MEAMKKRVLFILHLPPPVHGAAMVGQYLHDSSLINSEFECKYINLTTAKDLQDIGKGGIGKLWKYFKLLRKIVVGILKFKPQLVYVTPNACGGAFYKDFIVVWLVKLFGCKVVVHYHNKGVSTRQNKWLDDKLYRRFFKGIKVILLAEALYQDVERYVKQKDVYICPNGIPDVLEPEPVIGRHNGKPHILFLSNLIESKGVWVLLDALQQLKDKGYPFVCDFVGGETAEIDSRCFKAEVEKRNLESSVVYHGKKFGEEKNAFLKEADIFVFPTFYPNECFPLVLLEAMQYGVACVSTHEGGIPGIIEDGQTGWLVKRQSADDLAGKLIWMLAHPLETKAMGERGKKKFDREFTLSCFETRMKEILQKLLV